MHDDIQWRYVTSTIFWNDLPSINTRILAKHSGTCSHNAIERHHANGLLRVMYIFVAKIIWWGKLVNMRDIHMRSHSSQNISLLTCNHSSYRVVFFAWVLLFIVVFTLDQHEKNNVLLIFTSLHDSQRASKLSVLWPNNYGNLE